MIHSENWNPNLYLKFKKERTQPALDLANRINVNLPLNIVDLGCGPGNSTEILKRMWPSSEILGVDNSSQMIEKAKNDYPNQNWLLADISTWNNNNKFDIIFSNATLQWLPGQDKIINKLFDMLTDSGCLAVQVPLNYDSPLHKSVVETSMTDEFTEFTNESRNLLYYHEADFYYEILTKLSSNFDIWTTTYSHILNDHNDLLEWYKSTGMKIFLEPLPDDEAKRKFEKSVLEKCTKRYKKQSDGKIIFGFKRLFFTVYK